MPDSIADRVCTIIARVADSGPDEVRPEASLRDDLGIGRTRCAFVGVRISETFGVRIPDSAVEAFVTVGDVIEALGHALAAQRRAA